PFPASAPRRRGRSRQEHLALNPRLRLEWERMFSLLSISDSRERRFDPGAPGDRRSPDSGPSAGAIGMTFFLFSVTMLFGGGLVALLWTRAQYPHWPPPGLPPLHAGFFVATALLLSVSVTLYAASRAVRRERLTQTHRLLMLALLL